MEFISSMSTQSTIKKSFLKKPDFGLDVLDAVNRTRDDGKARLVGNILERFIVECSAVTGKVRILMVTGFQVFEESEEED